ncbi:IclR family transcriptional regulator [Halorarum salinum]|uniref:IclR family transcriptional regulator n=1 Tax=Halorarum salinum TaxID=2743089 RepID=A0A7D5QE12_9EURY|nr:IclR family transcriptional regulator [Halobaculum salinum]QLG60362.1 IclR family transcriptional regulator [Halobaculum salinum]
MANQGSRMVKSGERVFDILEFVREEAGVTVTEVARELDIAPSTAHQYLQTIEASGFLVREGNDYYISLQFLDYGESARQRGKACKLAEENVDELARETNERAQFVVMEHGQGVVLYTATGDRAVKTNVTLGRHVYLHATAAGKAILSQLPESAVLEIIDEHGLPAVTSHTITEQDALLTELDEIRQAGVAQNNQEDIHGLRAVGVPVTDEQDHILGALSVSGPTHRITGDVLEHEIPDLLLGMANELELKVEYTD